LLQIWRRASATMMVCVILAQTSVCAFDEKGQLQCFMQKEW